MGWFKDLMNAPIKLEWGKKPKEDFVCKSCNYGWTSRKKFGTPAFCPRCHSDNILKVDRG